MFLLVWYCDMCQTEEAMTVLCLYCCKRASDSGILFSNDFLNNQFLIIKKKKIKKKFFCLKTVF